ncbi:hypothetical protein VEIDISOL_00864 [Veillonella dispar ATCC 17748]|uniref:Uncharacterized protein n=1 Tax=Veillonella dispar ATCC 17748 TaxID=546273 RepID=C4FPN8_9FIRM|nr:hypothetical protein VEIDISOL_00864 [Veillonella dispar ATCC 17748]
MYAITLSTIATLTHNTTPITIRTILTMQHPTITTKIIAVQTLILEDAADIEDNLVSILKAYSTKMYYRLLSYITRILFNLSKYS